MRRTRSSRPETRENSAKSPRSPVAHFFREELLVARLVVQVKLAKQEMVNQLN